MCFGLKETVDVKIVTDVEVRGKKDDEDVFNTVNDNGNEMVKYFVNRNHLNVLAPEFKNFSNSLRDLDNGKCILYQKYFQKFNKRTY